VSIHRLDTLAYDNMYLRPETVSVDGLSLGYDRDIDETQRAASGCEARGTLFQRARHHGRFGETVEVTIDLEAMMLAAGRSPCLWTGTGDVPVARGTTTVEIPVVALLDGTEDRRDGRRPERAARPARSHPRSRLTSAPHR